MHAGRTAWEHREVSVVNDFNAQTVFVTADGHFVLQRFKLFVFRQFFFELLLEFFKVFFVLLFSNGFAFGLAQLFWVAAALALPTLARTLSFAFAAFGRVFGFVFIFRTRVGIRVRTAL